MKSHIIFLFLSLSLLTKWIELLLRFYGFYSFIMLSKSYISFNCVAIPHKIFSMDSASAGRISAVISRQLLFKKWFIMEPSSSSPSNKLANFTEAFPMLKSTLISHDRLFFPSSWSEAVELSSLCMITVASTSAEMKTHLRKNASKLQ